MRELEHYLSPPICDFSCDFSNQTLLCIPSRTLHTPLQHSPLPHLLTPTCQLLLPLAHHYPSSHVGHLIGIPSLSSSATSLYQTCRSSSRETGVPSPPPSPLLCTSPSGILLLPFPVLPSYPPSLLLASNFHPSFMLAGIGSLNLS